MSVLSDIYISLENEAVKYDAAPNSFTERVQCKGMTPLELSTLWAIMRGVEWDAALMDDFACLLETNGGERLVHSFPGEMVTALGQLSSDRIRDVSSKWATTEEMASSPEDIQPVVEEMVRLARSASASRRGLYIWNSV
jgi:hypothetical protein